MGLSQKIHLFKDEISLDSFSVIYTVCNIQLHQQNISSSPLAGIKCYFVMHNNDSNSFSNIFYYLPQTADLSLVVYLKTQMFTYGEKSILFVYFCVWGKKYLYALQQIHCRGAFQTTSTPHSRDLVDVPDHFSKISLFRVMKQNEFIKLFSTLMFYSLFSKSVLLFC